MPCACATGSLIQGQIDVGWWMVDGGYDMNNKITIRSASSDDAQVCAGLIYSTSGRLTDYLFGFNDPAKARDVLARLFAWNHNRFSHQFADVAIINGKVVALLLAYPSKIMKRLEIPTARQLFNIYGCSGMYRFLRNAWPMIRISEAGRGEYFIDAVAVLPGFQGRGIGTRLLTYAEEKASGAGLARCSMIVDVVNDRAHSLYQRLGYQTVATVRIKRLQQRIGYQGFYRMVKILA